MSKVKNTRYKALVLTARTSAVWTADVIEMKGTSIKPITATLVFRDLKINKEKAFFQIFIDRKIPYSFSFPEVPWSVRSHQYPLLY